jgi:hypothetical protein
MSFFETSLAAAMSSFPGLCLPVIFVEVDEVMSRPTLDDSGAVLACKAGPVSRASSLSSLPFLPPSSIESLLKSAGFVLVIACCIECGSFVAAIVFAAVDAIFGTIGLIAVLAVALR